MGLTAVTFQTTFMISLVILNSLEGVSSNWWDSRESIISSIKNGKLNSLERVSSDWWDPSQSINSQVSSIKNEVSRILQHSSDLSRQHIASVNNEVSKALKLSSDLSRQHIASMNNVEPSTAKPTESSLNEWKRPTTSSYIDEAPSTAKPTESQSNDWDSPTTSVESTSGTIPKTTKSPLCEPASYSQKDAIKNRIEFVNDTSISQHPYQLALEGGGSHICRGSILSEVWALTAAHCVHNQPPKWLAFRAGSSLREEGGTVHPVEYYIYHQNYRMGSLDFDVAVVRVQEDFRYDNWISPVNLNIPPYNGGVMAVATGWGYKQRAQLTKPKQLQSADLLILDSETCRRQYPGQITERMLCAEDPNNITDICSDDSGGALVLRGSHTQVGIVSRSYLCVDGRPSVYTNVSSVAAWIREQVC